MLYLRAAVLWTANCALCLIGCGYYAGWDDCVCVLREVS
jgi:hypothetical protein